MDGGFIEWLIHLTSLPANIIGIAIGSSVIGSGVWWRLRHRLRHAAADIRQAHQEITDKIAEIARRAAQVDELRATLEALALQLPETIVEKVNQNIQQNNYTITHNLVRDWLEHQGEPIATLLRFEAGWAACHAVGDAHVAGLVVAEAFASAAHAVWPRDLTTAELSEELKKCRYDAQINTTPTLRHAISLLSDIDADRILQGRMVDRALALQEEVDDFVVNGFYRIARIQIERAIDIFRSELGAVARQTIRARVTRILLLIYSAQPNDALADVKNLATELGSTLGQDDLDTLLSRRLLAEVLSNLERSTEALPILWDVLAKQIANSQLGPHHKETFATRFLLARVLDFLGHSREALPIIEYVAAHAAADPDLGPDNHSSLLASFLLARTFDNLGRHIEALDIIKDVAARAVAHPQLGPDHHSTLSIQHLHARVLSALDYATEALFIIERIVARYAANPEFGPDNPHTLACCGLLAQVLNELGRAAEALPIIENVVARLSKLDFDLDGHTILGAELRHAQVLNNLNRTVEALPIIQSVVARCAASPELGPDNPLTLDSLHWLAEIRKNSDLSSP